MNQTLTLTRYINRYRTTVPRDMKSRWFHILLAMAGGPRHGLAVMREVRQSSNGAIHLWPATLYGSLEELMDLGRIRKSTTPSGGRSRASADGITG